MRHLRPHEREVADSDAYADHTVIESNGGNFVRLWSDRFTPEDGTLTLAEWHLLSLKMPVPS